MTNMFFLPLIWQLSIARCLSYLPLEGEKEMKFIVKLWGENMSKQVKEI
jgi:hypothetical protein